MGVCTEPCYPRRDGPPPAHPDSQGRAGDGTGVAPEVIDALAMRATSDLGRIGTAVVDSSPLPDRSGADSLSSANCRHSMTADSRRPTDYCVAETAPRNATFTARPELLFAKYSEYPPMVPSARTCGSSTRAIRPRRSSILNAHGADHDARPIATQTPTLCLSVCECGIVACPSHHSFIAPLFLESNGLINLVAKI